MLAGLHCCGFALSSCYLAFPSSILPWCAPLPYWQWRTENEGFFEAKAQLKYLTEPIYNSWCIYMRTAREDTVEEAAESLVLDTYNMYHGSATTNNAVAAGEVEEQGQGAAAPEGHAAGEAEDLLLEVPRTETRLARRYSYTRLD